MPSACGAPWQCAGTAVSVGGYRVGYGDWVGTGVGYTGYYPASLKAEAGTAERAPEALQGAGVGGTCCSARPSPQTTHSSHPVASGARSAV